MAPPGYLLSFSNPGPKVELGEFHDWYNNDHIAVRMKMPCFLSCSRWEAADGKLPGFANTYDLESFAATQQPDYLSLATTRSEREKEILSRVGLVERRHYEARTSPVPSVLAPYDDLKPGPYAVFESLEIKPEATAEVEKWLDEVYLPALAKVPGWVRSRTFVFKDIRRVGLEAEGLSAPLTYLAAHEWASLDALESADKTTTTPEDVAKGLAARERRVMKVSKSFEKK